MKQVGYDISSLVEQVNHLRSSTSTNGATNADGDDAISQISFILSKQIDTLTWVDNQTGSLLFRFSKFEYKFAMNFIIFHTFFGGK